MKRLSRRTLLRGAGGVAVALPFLDAMSRPRPARAANVAKRFIVFFSANGTIMDTDALPGEMLITATIETECNLFSITNVRVKHRPDIVTPNPQ